MAKKKTKKFIQEAIKHPGALRARARREGLLGGADDTLSATDLNKLEQIANKENDTRLKRQVTLARNLKKMRKH